MSTAFMGLTSEQQLGSTHPEVQRLTKILNVYEKECLRLKESIGSLEKINENCVASLKEGESNRAAMNKQIRSLNDQIKYNKIASDGIAKKAATYEFEFNNAKEERKTLLENQILDRKRLVYLEQANNDDRSKLLREMHENDVLRRKNGVLEATVATLEKELRGVRQDLLIKMEKNESLVIENEQNRRAMREQSDEILKQGQELTLMTEEKRFLSETNLAQEEFLSEKKKEAKDFEEENWRLRTELTCLSRSATEKSLAFANYRPSTTNINATGGKTAYESRRASLKTRERLSTGGSTGSFILPNTSEMDCLPMPGSADGHMMSVDTSGFNTRGESSMSTKQFNWTVNPASSPMKTVGSTMSFDKNDLNKIAISASQHAPTATISLLVDRAASPVPNESGNGTSNNSNIGVKTTGSDDGVGVYFAQPPSPILKKVVIPSKVNINNPTLRTKFLGSGLGFQNDFDNPLQKSGGSAKQVLKKILEDFERNK